MSVEEPGGGPVEGALVCISRTDFSDYWVGTTDVNGEVIFDDLTTHEVGEYDIVVSAHNAAPYESTFLSNGAADMLVINSDDPGGNGRNNGTPDEYRFVRTGQDGEYLDVYLDGQFSRSVDFALLDKIFVNGSGDDDTLTVDLSVFSPIPAGGVSYRAERGETIGESLIVQNGTINDVVYNVTQRGEGTILLDGSTVAFTAVAPEASVAILPAQLGTLLVNLPDTSLSTVEFRDDGNPENNTSLLDVNAGLESVRFTNTTTRLEVNVSSGDDTVTVNSLDPNFIAHVEINGHGGTDTLTLYGRPGDDTFDAYPTHGTLASGDVTVTANDVERFYAYASEGGDDVAYLHGSEGNDELEALPGAAQIFAATFLQFAAYFDHVYAYSEGGTDTATLYVQGAANTFTGYPDQATLTDSIGVGTTVYDCANVQVIGDLGGTSTAHLSGSMDDDILQADEYSVSLSDASESWTMQVFYFGTINLHASGGTDSVPDPLPENVTLVGLFWDEQGDGNWNDIDPGSQNSRWVDWDGNAVQVYPNNADTDAVVRADALADTVTVTENHTARDVTVENDAGLVLCNDLTLEVAGRLVMGGGARYECELGDPANGLVAVTGDAYLAGTLALQAVSKLHGPEGEQLVQWYGDQVRTIVSAEGGGTIYETFDTVPDPQPETWFDNQGVPINWGVGHLGYGVFLTRLGNEPSQPGLTYTGEATQVHLFQACDGDTNGDRNLNGDDIQRILAELKFATGLPADWTQGDFTDDNLCNGDDIQALLATGLWPTYGYDEGGRDGGDGRLLLDGGGVVDLIISPDGLTVDTHGTTINSWVFTSEVGVFTGENANLLGSFREDEGDRIGSAFFELTGQHFLGDVIGAEFDSMSFEDLCEDLTFTYTIEGQAGTYEGIVQGRTLFWDQQGNGNWDDIDPGTGHSRWLDESQNPLDYYPDDQFTDGVVRSDTVSVAEDRTVRDLIVESGTAAVSSDTVLTVDRRLVLCAAAGAQLALDDDFAMHDDLEYVPQLQMGPGMAGLLESTGFVDLEGELAPQALGHLGNLENREWGGYTRTIVTAGSDISGERFDSVPPVHCIEGHLGYGVFMTDLFDPGAGGHGQAVTYETGAVHVDLFQAAPGDTDGNRTVDGDDMQRILGSGKFGTGQYAIWPEGDFNGDHLCNGDDIQMMLATGLYGTGVYWPGQRESLGTGSGEVLDRVGMVDLVIAPEGLTVDTNGTTINSWVFTSEVGVFTGDDANLLGFFREDADARISGAFFWLSGRHFLGDVIGEEQAGVALLKDLTFTYTIDGQAGLYEGNLILVPGGDGLSGGIEAAGAPPTAGDLAAAADGLTWLYEFEEMTTQDLSSDGSDPAKEAVDLLLDSYLP